MLNRLRDLARLEFTLWTVSGISLRHRIAYAISRLTTLPFGGFIWWFGERLYSDNRLGLLLMPGYLIEIRAILDSIGSGGSPARGSRMVLDVGANVGQFARTMLALDPTCVVVSVEPNPVIIETLRRNMNSYSSRWSVLTHAVGPKAKESTFFVVRGKSAQGSIFHDNAAMGLVGHPVVERIQIDEGPITALEITGASGMDLAALELVKLDVEGYELQALEGLSELMFRYLWVEIIRERDGGLDVDEMVENINRIAKRNVELVTREGNNYLMRLEESK